MKLSVALILLVSTGNGLIPKPLSDGYTNSIFTIPATIEVSHNSPQCFVLDEAIRRFLKRTSFKQPPLLVKTLQNMSITTLQINISAPCDEEKQLVYPSEDANEQYYVLIDGGIIRIDAPEVWGAIHGLSTVAQLIYSNQAGEKHVLGGIVYDSPRWPFRSFLIDSSRHFLSVEKIFQFLEAMETAKYNVLHWHLVDDHSFPYDSYTFPNLAGKGSYSPVHAVYTQQDVRRVIEYARQRGIRVMPEFDTPGHTLSWGAGYPELLTPCYKAGYPDGTYGPMNPTKTTTYDFLEGLFREIAQVFPDTAIHFGGDEVEFNCWASNPDIGAFMNKSGFNASYELLEDYFVSNLLHRVENISKKIKPYVWQEVFDNKVRLNNAVTVHVWKSTLWPVELFEVTQTGTEVVFSACWYLNYIAYAEDWISYYQCDPSTFTSNATLLALLKGGGAAMWGEFVDDTNLISRAWPRGAVVAERLWSPHSVVNVSDMRIRLNEYRCRLLAMGINAEPVTGPQFCHLF